jgi:copper(I)-binding protein
MRAVGRVSALVLIFACGIGVSAAAAASSITIEKPWMRFIIRARPAAGYFILRNNGEKPVKLTGASSPACGTLMLHQSQEKSGMDHMTHVKGVSVPAHGSVEFAPGGYHLMCMSPGKAMKVGANVQVTLKFADGATTIASFPVKGPGGK